MTYNFRLLTSLVLVVLFIVISFSLGFPLLDDHAWRQSITTVVAQNYARFGYDLFHPLYDICGDISPGVFATEFPILNIIIAFFYKTFGWNIAYARGANLVFSFLGLYFFYLIVEKLFTRRMAFFSVLFMTGSMYLIFSRKVMPDTFSLSLVMMGVYSLLNYLDNKKLIALLAGMLLCICGIGAKLPSVVFLTILSIPLLKSDNLLSKTNILLAIGVILSVLVVGLWYFAWLPQLQSRNECFPLMYPVSLKVGFENFISSYEQIFFRFRQAFLWVGPFILSILGLLEAIRRKKYKFVFFILVHTIIFSLFIIKSGVVFQNHNYYVIPAIPCLSICAAFFLDAFAPKKNWVLVFMVCFALGYPLYKLNQDALSTYDKEFTQLSSMLDNLGVPKRAKIMVNGHSFNPTMMYFTGRHGWNVNDDILEKYSWFIDYKKSGLEYIVVRKSTSPPKLKHKMIYEDEHFIVYVP